MGKLVSIAIVSLAALCGLCTLVLNVLSYVKPKKLDGNVATLYTVVSTAAYRWGILPAAVAVVVIVIINPSSTDVYVKYKRFIILMGACWFFAVVTGTFLSSTHSLRFRDGAWEAGGRFESWRKLSEPEARALMWLKVRDISSIALAESATVLYAALVLFARSRAADLGSRGAVDVQAPREQCGGEN